MSGLSRISNRAYMNDASYRIMKYLEAKLTDADGKIDDEKYDKLFAIMTGNMSVQLIISKLDKMYEDLFDKQYDNAVKLLNELNVKLRMNWLKVEMMIKMILMIKIKRNDSINNDEMISISYNLQINIHFYFIQL